MFKDLEIVEHQHLLIILRFLFTFICGLLFNGKEVYVD